MTQRSQETKTRVASSPQYGSIDIKANSSSSEDTASDASEFLPLTAGSSSSFDDLNNKKQQQNKTSRLVAVVATLAMIGVVGWVSFHASSDKKHRHSSQYGHSSSRGSSDDTTSLVSPYDVKGLLTTTRSSQGDFLPSPIWGEHVGGGESGPLQPLPTNSWMMNLVSHRAADAGPDDSTSVYTIPYIVDTAVPTEIMPSGGVRVHWPVMQASTKNIQMVDNAKNSVSLGAVGASHNNSSSSSKSKSGTASHYVVNPDTPLSELGVSLVWPATQMTTYLVRGMPYATMQYAPGTLPLLYSDNGPAVKNLRSDHQDEKPMIEIEAGGEDTTTNTSLLCGIGKKDDESSGSSSHGHTASSVRLTNKEIKVHLANSDFTWMLFFSHEVSVSCHVSSTDVDTRTFRLEVVEVHDGADETNGDGKAPLTVRLALLDECTTGKSDIAQHCRAKKQQSMSSAGSSSSSTNSTKAATTNASTKQYEQLLREHASVFPTMPELDFQYKSSEGDAAAASTATMSIDWKRKAMMCSKTDNNDATPPLLMFALPHHQEKFASEKKITDHCVHSFHGRTCLVEADEWALTTELGSPMSFNAARPPVAAIIPELAEALATDIHYQLSDNLLRGAADTYFSGKALARLARVILIADELKQLAAAAEGGSESESTNSYADVDRDTLEAAQEAAALVADILPSDKDVDDAVKQLKEGVEIWLMNGEKGAEAPFLYDAAWGGLVNCGCRYVFEKYAEDKGYCNNTAPDDCPALSDVNVDFGFSLYNDHAYHEGYHVYAAAVVAKYDNEWAVEMHDSVMLYVRDFANPFTADAYFPHSRNKDWFLGSSWASGLVSAENSPHGRNEESSSEAIAAYEAVALYGQVMLGIFAKEGKKKEDLVTTAALVRDFGQLLTVSELEATNRYWHVWSSDDHVNVYPAQYKQPVVGMLYETMASFQTWFAPQAVVSYGIQLMPFTSVAERRDDPTWASILYPRYKAACEDAGDYCVKNGWSILQAGLLADTTSATASSGSNTTSIVDGGRKHIRSEALRQALSIPSKVFDSQGGLGNSLTNTIWYIATRK